MKEYIKRKYYIDKVKPFISKEIIKVITGQRRVGKSYFLLQLMDLIKDTKKDTQIIYINKELHKYRKITNASQLIEYIKQNETKAVNKAVFIDEIQEIDDFEKALRSLHAEGNYDLYCTGSNANLLSGELATFLSGRYIQVQIFPLSYKEFLNFHVLNDNNKNLQLYFRYGGLPYLRHLDLQDTIVFDYLGNIYQTILLLLRYYHFLICYLLL